MSDQSAIEWTDSTWNVVTGCTRVSPGCANCYIERTPPFRKVRRRFEMVAPGQSSTGLVFHPERLERVPKGPRIFVNSLSDLFHEDVPDGFILDVFRVMEARRDRTFQVLTKRPERARDWFHDYRPFGAAALHPPAPNVWMGVSVENSRYTWRADVLREIPAAVRFISAEPLLGSLFESRYGDDRDELLRLRKPLDLAGIDWVIVGGESGPGARPFDVVWAREIVASCREHGAAPFVKQLGARPIISYDVDGTRCNAPVFGIHDRKGGDWDEWAAHVPDLRVREFPVAREVVAA